MLTLMAILTRVFGTMSARGPRPMVICGPSGSGKSTLLRKLFEEFPETFGFSVSHTTRKPRPGEENAIHYYFVSIDEMKSSIDDGKFLETATFSGNIYGTSKQAVRDVQAKGKVCVLDIEIEGVKQIKKTDLDPILIFNNPPSINELERRLRGRNTETEESLQKRLEASRREMDYGNEPGNFHLVVHNEDLEIAYRELRNYILKELQIQKTHGVNVSLKCVK